MNGTSALYDLFWENSKLGRRTVPAFRRRLEHWAVADHDPEPLVYPGSDVRLRRADDRLARLIAARRSRRAFSTSPLPARRLGRLLSAFAAGTHGARGFPSAGALYPLEIFCLLENVSGSPGRAAVHYNADNHSLSVVGPLPAVDDYADALTLDGFEGIPHVMVVFVLFPSLMTEKYGERGGRFALIEVGHAAQNLALRLVREGLVGCEVGGLLDDEVVRILGLDRKGAQVALGYACGLAPRAERARLISRASSKRPTDESLRGMRARARKITR